jgi:hypothetical protein
LLVTALSWPTVASAKEDPCADTCVRHGRCTFVADRCVATTTVGCRHAEVCRDEGRCRPLRGVCAAPPAPDDAYSYLPPGGDVEDGDSVAGSVMLGVGIPLTVLGGLALLDGVISTVWLGVVGEVNGVVVGSFIGGGAVGLAVGIPLTVHGGAELRAASRSREAIFAPSLVVRF